MSTCIRNNPRRKRNGYWLAALIPSLARHELTEAWRHSKSRLQWICPGEVKSLAAQHDLTVRQFDAVYADVKVESGWRRIRRSSNSPAVPIENHFESDNAKSDVGELGSFPLEEAEAAEATLRWCDSFVAALGLCPWAKKCLAAPGSIRVKVVRQGHQVGRCIDSGSTSGMKCFEEMIRESSMELLDLVGETPGDWLQQRSDIDKEDLPSSLRMEDKEWINDIISDSSIAITFVVAAPDVCNGSSISPDFDFLNFQNFVNNFEERLFREAEAGANPPLGDLVTVAGFHPDWRFAGSEEANAPINFEKRSPYPTVSIVLSRHIDEAGPKVTERIAAHNEEVLVSCGSSYLAKLFEKTVLPSTGIKDR